MKAPTLRHLAAALAIVVLAPVALHAQKSKSWSEFLGGPESAHYSPLKQNTTANVNKLTVAWSYETADEVAYTFCPLVVDNIAYVAAKVSTLVAHGPTTGK